MHQNGFKHKLAAILSADVVEYTRLIKEDETATIKMLSAYRELIAKLVEQHNGRVVDTAGDNLLAEFASVVDATRGAIAIQKEIKIQNTNVRPKSRIIFRMGINLSGLAIEGDRIYGDGVNIAARLQTLAVPGGICISGSVFDQIEDRLSLEFKYLGEKHFKNTSKPNRVYEILIGADLRAFDNEGYQTVEDKKPSESGQNSRRRAWEQLDKGSDRELLSPILATKLYLPEPKEDFVQRTSLLERLNLGLDRKLTLISAPAGYGKTTLLTQWITQNKLSAVWISLEKGDSDPVQFLRYVITALRSIEPNIGKAVWASFQSPQPVPIKTAILSLIDEIVDIPNEFILVLDDFHTIENADIHNTIGDLINLLPSKVHLVIATRADPSLPLSRLRVRNQINELRASDLCFSLNESTRFLNEMMKLGLSRQEISILESRTEGWIAGLQLAALSIQGREDTSRFIKAFAGDDRLIVDYLAEEVLNLQSEKIQQFLLQTSILNRLSGALCDFVTQKKGSQAILEDLEMANLFVIPLDNKRRWYRYHHLFSDLLGARMHHTQPEMVTALHRRASRWFEQNGQIAETVNHALSAGEFDRAAIIIEKNTLALLLKGELQTLLGWIRKLPKKVACRRPGLSIYQAWALVIAGQVNDLESMLKDAEQLIQHFNIKNDKSVGEATRREMMGNIAAIRACAAIVTGNFRKVIEYATVAEELLPEDSLWTRSLVIWALGIANRINGNLQVAEQSFIEVVRLGRKMDNVWTSVGGMTELAMVYQSRGQLHQSAALCQDAIRLAAEQGLESLGFTGRVQACLADVLYQQNDLAAAQKFAEKSLENTRRWENPIYSVFAYNVLACVLQAQHDYKGSLEVVAKADQICDKFPVGPRLTGMLAKNKIRMWLAHKDKARVDRWSKENKIEEMYNDTAFSEIHGVQSHLLITQARVLIFQGKIDEALSLLERLNGILKSGGRISTLIEILILQAISFQSKNDTTSALKMLNTGLKYAEQGGHIRVFIEEGPPIAKLLEKCLDSKINVPRAYVKKLLSVFQISKFIKTDDDLVERLSDRELEVLRFIAAGHSNKKVTEELFISMSTVKTHLRNIYGKLDVHSRTEAIVKAKKMDLL